MIGLVYFTNTDITGQLVEACATGARNSGAAVYAHRIVGEDIVGGRFRNPNVFKELSRCAAIIFAAPTYMGGPAAQFKAFADASSEVWSEQKWAGKVAAGITSGTAANGDQSVTLQYFSTLASQHGMVWVGLDLPYGQNDRGLNRLGSQMGVVAGAPDGVIDSSDHETASYLGARVVQVASRSQAET